AIGERGRAEVAGQRGQQVFTRGMHGGRVVRTVAFGQYRFVRRREHGGQQGPVDVGTTEELAQSRMPRGRGRRVPVAGQYVVKGKRSQFLAGIPAIEAVTVVSKQQGQLLRGVREVQDGRRGKAAQQ